MKFHFGTLGIKLKFMRLYLVEYNQGTISCSFSLLTISHLFASIDCLKVIFGILERNDIRIE